MATDTLKQLLTVVKVINVKDNHKIMNLQSQSQSDRHLAFHPTGIIIAEEPELVKKVNGIINAMDEESEACWKIAWHPDGRAFAAQTPTR
ncbi:hypothetical protein L873DRAFT_1824309, partial [Choiromyces venosus 120613-1]